MRKVAGLVRPGQWTFSSQDATLISGTPPITAPTVLDGNPGWRGTQVVRERSANSPRIWALTYFQWFRRPILAVPWGNSGTFEA